MPKVLLTGSVTLPQEGTRTLRVASAGEEIEISQEVADRFVRIGVAELVEDKPKRSSKRTEE